MTDSRKILFDLGHPAHVHFFRNTISILKKSGWQVYVLARDKEVTHELLEAYNIDYTKGSSQKKGLQIIGEFFQWFFIAFKMIRVKKINMVVSLGSPAGAWAAKLNGIPHLAFNDTEIAWDQRLLYGTASSIIFTPYCLLANYGVKQIKYMGIHDLAYLAPKYFTSDKQIKKLLGLEPEEQYAVLRFVSWEATHDWGKHKTQKKEQIEIFNIVSKKMKVFISAEGKLPDELDDYRLRISPHQFHDVIASASIVVGDGATTATEAAVLGVPSIYISELYKYLGSLQLLSDYGLLTCVSSYEKALQHIDSMLCKETKINRQKKRDTFLKEHIDVSEFIASECKKFLFVKRMGGKKGANAC